MKCINWEQIFISFSRNINTYLCHSNSLSFFRNERLRILEADDKVPMTGTVQMSQDTRPKSTQHSTGKHLAPHQMLQHLYIVVYFIFKMSTAKIVTFKFKFYTEILLFKQTIYVSYQGKLNRGNFLRRVTQSNIFMIESREIIRDLGFVFISRASMVHG